jgi:hypothetical protein
MAAVGAVAAASLGGFVLTRDSSSAPFEALPSWGFFTPAQWKSVSGRIEARGFTASSIHVVEGLMQHYTRPLALVAATSARGRTCFVPVEGVTLRPTICRLTKPVVLFTARDTWLPPPVNGRPALPIPITDVLGVARRDVAGISLEQFSAGRRLVQGLSLTEGAGMLTFAGGYDNASVLRARNARGEVLFQLAFPR